MPIQILLTLLSIGALWSAGRSYRLGQMDRRKFLGWSFLWLLMVFIIWQPEATSLLAAYVGVGRGVDLVIYVSVAVLFLMLFKTSRKIDRLEKSLTDMVRALALEHRDDRKQ